MQALCNSPNHFRSATRGFALGARSGTRTSLPGLAALTLVAVALAEDGFGGAFAGGDFVAAGGTRDAFAGLEALGTPDLATPETLARLALASPLLAALLGLGCGSSSFGRNIPSGSYLVGA